MRPLVSRSGQDATLERLSSSLTEFGSPPRNTARPGGHEGVQRMQSDRFTKGDLPAGHSPAGRCTPRHGPKRRLLACRFDPWCDVHPPRQCRGRSPPPRHPPDLLTSCSPQGAVAFIADCGCRRSESAATAVGDSALPAVLNRVPRPGSRSPARERPAVSCEPLAASREPRVASSE